MRRIRFGSKLAAVVVVAMTAAGCAGQQSAVDTNGSVPRQTSPTATSTPPQVAGGGTTVIVPPGCGVGADRVVDPRTHLSWTKPQGWSSVMTAGDQVFGLSSVLKPVEPGKDRPLYHGDLFAWQIPDHVNEAIPFTADNLDKLVSNLADGYVQFGGGDAAADLQIEHVQIQGLPAARFSFASRPKSKDGFGRTRGVFVLSNGDAAAVIGGGEANVEAEVDRALQSVCVVTDAAAVPACPTGDGGRSVDDASGLSWLPPSGWDGTQVGKPPTSTSVSVIEPSVWTGDPAQYSSSKLEYDALKAAAERWATDHQASFVRQPDSTHPESVSITGHAAARARYSMLVGGKPVDLQVLVVSKPSAVVALTGWTSDPTQLNALESAMDSTCVVA